MEDDCNFEEKQQILVQLSNFSLELRNEFKSNEIIKKYVIFIQFHEFF